MKCFLKPQVSIMAICLLAPAASAQNLITSNTTIHNALCVGFDCATSESYGSDTIRLKENNLRIHFDDTSTGAFPDQDWRIEVNASASGGGEYFRVLDATANRNIFTLEANAPSDALVVDNGGRVGFGTANPSVELHSANGDTPTLRLEQDGSSGFAPQRWDVAGNETSFFVRDATNGSTLPLRIRPGAPSNSLVVDTDGDVGIGVLTATAPLDVVDSAVTVALFRGNGTKVVDVKSDNNGAVQYRMISDSTNRRFVALNAAGSPRSQILFGDNDIRLAGATDSGANLWAIIGPNGIRTQGPTCAAPNFCDAVFDPTVYTPASIKENAAFMWENMYLPAVGPTGPDLPFDVTQKTAGILHELEKAHIYIEQLDTRAEAQQEAIAAQQAENAALTGRLASLEARLETLAARR